MSGSAVEKRSRRREKLARLEPRLQTGEDHRPAAVELVVRALAKLVVGHGQTARVADRFELSVGEALDWWRVEDLDDMHLVRLRAEMRLPGLAWLELIVDTDDQGRTVFHQRALFHPKGLAGHFYWAVIRPFHGVVFGGMQRNIARAAERLPRGVTQA